MKSEEAAKVKAGGGGGGRKRGAEDPREKSGDRGASKKHRTGDKKVKEADRDRDRERRSSSSTSSKSKSQAKSEGAGAQGKVRVRHILKKHRLSSRPVDLNNKKIKRTLDEAMQEMEMIRGMMLEVAEGGAEELHQTFKATAKDESDCKSAKRGGDLGSFEYGKMKKDFSDASFALPINGEKLV